jgi:hypothetical protein
VLEEEISLEKVMRRLTALVAMLDEPAGRISVPLMERTWQRHRRRRGRYRMGHGDLSIYTQEVDQQCLARLARLREKMQAKVDEAAASLRALGHNGPDGYATVMFGLGRWVTEEIGGTLKGPTGVVADCVSDLADVIDARARIEGFLRIREFLLGGAIVEAMAQAGCSIDAALDERGEVRQDVVQAMAARLIPYFHGMNGSERGPAHGTDAPPWPARAPIPAMDQTGRLPGEPAGASEVLSTDSSVPSGRVCPGQPAPASEADTGRSFDDGGAARDHDAITPAGGGDGVVTHDGKLVKLDTSLIEYLRARHRAINERAGIP